jgi:hypothetical protein
MGNSLLLTQEKWILKKKVNLFIILGKGIAKSSWQKDFKFVIKKTKFDNLEDVGKEKKYTYNESTNYGNSNYSKNLNNNYSNNNNNYNNNYNNNNNNYSNNNYNNDYNNNNNNYNNNNNNYNNNNNNNNFNNNNNNNFDIFSNNNFNNNFSNNSLFDNNNNNNNYNNNNNNNFNNNNNNNNFNNKFNGNLSSYQSVQKEYFLKYLKCQRRIIQVYLTEFYTTTSGEFLSSGKFINYFIFSW